jgi:hypothetical protein
LSCWCFIDREQFCRLVYDSAEKNLQLERNVCFLQPEVADLREANLRLAIGSRAGKQETNGLYKRHDEFVAMFAHRNENPMTRSSTFGKSSGFYGNKTMNQIPGSNSSSIIGERH